MVWSTECIARDITQDLRQWHKSSIDAEKKSYKEALGLTTRQITVNPKQISTKIHLSYLFEPCVNIKHHKLETPGAETRENRSLPRQLQRRVEQTLLRCEYSSAKRPTKYTRLAARTQVFHRSREKIWQGSIGPYNTPNNCKPETDFQQKFTFHICSNHVLISDITSLKRQVQRQERTGQFHVNSKEEWNKLYDGVNIRVQSNRQITQDLRQWHKSSIEAEKNIAQESIGPYNTPKQQ